MTIDVPLSDMGHGLLGHNQLTTIDQSELSSQLGLSLGGGTILPRPRSPEQPLSATPSPSGSLQDEDLDDFKQVREATWGHNFKLAKDKFRYFAFRHTKQQVHFNGGIRQALLG